MVSIYCWFKTKTHEWWCRGHGERGVLICAKILEDLFFFDQRTHFLSIFERKCGVLGKDKTENFGCDTAFMPKNLSSLSAHAMICPQHHDHRCFLSLKFAWFPGVKTKKPVGLTGVGLSEKFLIIQPPLSPSPSSAKASRKTGKNSERCLELIDK